MEKLVKDILGSISKLDFDWYKSKSLVFKKEPFYDNVYGKIYSIIPTNEYYENSEGAIIGLNKDLIIDLDFNAYCWNSSFYGSLSYEELNQESFEHNLPFDSKIIANQIIIYIEEFTKKFTEIRAIQSCIASILNEINDWCIKEIKTSKVPDYEECIEYFIIQTQKIIYKDFDYVQRQIDVLDNPNSKLEFELTQENLAGLLFILSKAEMFKPVNSNRDNFLKFCSEFFYFKFKEGYVRPKSFKTFSDKYKKFERGENSTLLAELKSKLIAVLKKL